LAAADTGCVEITARTTQAHAIDESVELRWRQELIANRNAVNA
jgi:hypothetical protein